MKIACIGSAHYDVKAKSISPVVPKSSNPVRSMMTFGGVARNVAENLKKLGFDVDLISRVGNDDKGDHLIEYMRSIGVYVDNITRSSTASTATYNALLDTNGELYVAAADMEIYDEVTRALLEPSLTDLSTAEYWIIDASFPEETLKWLCENKPSHIKIWAMAISPARVTKWRSSLNKLDAIFLNEIEIETLTRIYNGEKAAEELVKQRVQAVIVTQGAKGAFITTEQGTFSFQAPPAHVVDVTGAGDALTAGVLFGISKGNSMEQSLPYGLSAAKLTIESDSTVFAGMSAERL